MNDGKSFVHPHQYSVKSFEHKETMRTALPPELDVTVVIPAYNRATLITRALNSVLNQSSRPREIVVVDDASSDDTVARVEAWRDQAGFPVRIEKLAKNGGVAAARNHAMQVATTRYIAFLDSDDEHLPETLTTLVSVLEETPDAVLAFADAAKVMPTKRIPNAMFGAKLDIRTIADPIGTAEQRRFMLRDPKSAFLKASLIATCSTCFRRDDALAVGGMPGGFRNGEDWLFWLKLSQRGRFVFVQEDLALVHRHLQNLTSPSSAADTSLAKLAGYHAILNGSLGINIDASQRQLVETFMGESVKLLRYQSSRLGFVNYLRYVSRVPGERKRSLMAHVLTDPRSTLRSVALSFARKAEHTSD